MAGTPNLETQVEKKVPTQDSTEMEVTSRPVDHGQKIRKSLTGGQRTHDIDVNMRESSGRHRNGGYCRKNVSGNFTSLTPKSGSCPQAHIMRKARSNKFRRY